MIRGSLWIWVRAAGSWDCYPNPVGVYSANGNALTLWRTGLCECGELSAVDLLDGAGERAAQLGTWCHAGVSKRFSGRRAIMGFYAQLAQTRCVDPIVQIKSPGHIPRFKRQIGLETMSQFVFSRLVPSRFGARCRSEFNKVSLWSRIKSHAGKAHASELGSVKLGLQTMSQSAFPRLLSRLNRARSRPEFIKLSLLVKIKSYAGTSHGSELGVVRLGLQAMSQFAFPRLVSPRFGTCCRPKFN